MQVRFPEHVVLARPTPLEVMARTSAVLGRDLWVKRDDLTGSVLSGNKARKLEFLAAEALRQEADTLITCGGVNSNHARATAFVAAHLGLSSHLVLRGEPRHPPTGNLLLDRWVGADITFIPPSAWPRRDALMAELAAQLAAAGKTAYVIPEGGSNALGSLGYARAMEEIAAQAEALRIPLKRIYHATGSGGTTAGLALGASALGLDLEVVGVAVCNDASYFDQKIHAILDEAVALGLVTQEVRARARWRILDGHQGPGYALTTQESFAAQAAHGRREGLVLDPVYTGKAFLGMLAEDGPAIFLHTGGMFELFAYGEQVDALR